MLAIFHAVQGAKQQNAEQYNKAQLSVYMFPCFKREQSFLHPEV